jgi:hypothetical protein
MCAALAERCLNARKVYLERGKGSLWVKSETKTKKLLYNFALLSSYADFVGRNMAERRSCCLGGSRKHKSRKKRFEVAAELTV